MINFKERGVRKVTAQDTHVVVVNEIFCDFMDIVYHDPRRFNSFFSKRP